MPAGVTKGGAGSTAKVLARGLSVAARRQAARKPFDGSGLTALASQSPRLTDSTRPNKQDQSAAQNRQCVGVSESQAPNPHLPQNSLQLLTSGKGFGELIDVSVVMQQS